MPGPGTGGRLSWHFQTPVLHYIDFGISAYLFGLVTNVIENNISAYLFGLVTNVIENKKRVLMWKVKRV